MISLICAAPLSAKVLCRQRLGTLSKTTSCVADEADLGVRKEADGGEDKHK